MTAHFEKRGICQTCRNREMADDYEQKAHEAMGHKTETYTFGGYKPVTERRSPLVIPEKGEEKIKMDLAESYEDENPEEIGD